MLLPDCLWSFYFWGEGGRHRLHRWPELACLIHVCISLELFQFLATSASFLGAKAVRFKLKRREPGLCGVLYPDERALCVGLGLNSDTWNLLDVGTNSWHDCMSEHLSLLVKARFHVCFEKLTVKVASFQYIHLRDPFCFEFIFSNLKFSWFFMIFPQDFRRWLLSVVQAASHGAVLWFGGGESEHVTDLVMVTWTW